jgi:hypothetical protein
MTYGREEGRVSGKREMNARERHKISLELVQINI